VPTPGGFLDENGTAFIPGVSFPGTPVRMWFVDPAGRTTGALLPTGEPMDLLDGRHGPVPATLIDAGAPVVVLPVSAVGLTGRETPAEIDARPELLAELETLRRQAAVRMGLVHDPGRAERAIPKLALVAPPEPGEDADVVVRMLSMGRVHPALAITGSVALTMAARAAGTVVPRCDRDVLRLLTPTGVVETRVRQIDSRPAVGVLRTARRIADATLALPDSTPSASASMPQDVRDHEEVVQR
jgi:2-methylaconitate cis-trans-isomerase PrpF